MLTYIMYSAGFTEVRLFVGKTLRLYKGCVNTAQMGFPRATWKVVVAQRIVH